MFIIPPGVIEKLGKSEETSLEENTIESKSTSVTFADKLR
jgi:hypothetical protein